MLLFLRSVTHVVYDTLCKLMAFVRLPKLFKPCVPLSEVSPARNTSGAGGRRNTNKQPCIFFFLPLPTSDRFMELNP